MMQNGVDKLMSVIDRRIARKGDIGQWGTMVGRNAVCVNGAVYPLDPVVDVNFNGGEDVFVILNGSKTLATAVGN
jgi:hypothetical protein